MQPGASKADALLLLAAAIWGSGFVAQRLGMDHVGPMTFNAVRFAIGAAVLLPVIRLRRPRAASSAGEFLRPVGGHWRAGALAGSVLFVGAALQQAGLVHTTAGKGGFITGLYVVFVPMLGLLIGRRTAVTTWVGAALAAIGLYLLSMSGSLNVNRGDWLVLGGAVAWAAHVLVIGAVAPSRDPLKLAAIQFAVGSALALIAALATEEITWGGIAAARWAILYSGALSVGVAFTLQVVAQRHAPPAHAAILLSLEAVFAALAGWLCLGELLSARQMVGCALMLAGCLVAQARSRRESLPKQAGVNSTANS